MVTDGRRGPTRRALLAAALAVAGGARPAAAATPRIAAIDWAMAETAMALGQPPVAIAELVSFRHSAPQPPAPGTVDLGLRGTPNLEALSLTGPDVILSSGYYSFAEPQLRRIAPVFSRNLYTPGEAPFPGLMDLIPDLAAVLGSGAGEQVRRDVGAAFAALAVRVAGATDRDCLLMEMGDARHIRVFGDDSLFDGALRAMGLRNAWSARTRFAFAAPVPLERLADFPQARFVVIGDVPPQAARALRTGALWNSLPPVRAGRIHRLPEINGFGGIPSALRFGRDLADALESAA